MHHIKIILKSYSRVVELFLSCGFKSAHICNCCYKLMFDGFVPVASTIYSFYDLKQTQLMHVQSVDRELFCPTLPSQTIQGNKSNPNSSTDPLSYSVVVCLEPFRSKAA